MVQIAHSFAKVALIALFIVLTMPAVLFGRVYCLEYVLGRVSIDIKQALAAKLLTLPLAHHRDSSGGDTLSRALNDASSSELRLTYRDYGDQARDDVGFRIARSAD